MWKDLDRFKPLPKVIKNTGDLVLVIHCRTGQPYCGIVDGMGWKWDVVGKKTLWYLIKLFEHPDRYINERDWEIVNSGEF